MPEADNQPVTPSPTESPIMPTVGRIVLFTQEGTDNKGQPYPAVVTHVWGQNCVNLGVCDDGSYPFRSPDKFPTSVMFNADGAPGTWNWMPYQRGQAAKTDELTPRVEALEKAIAKRPIGANDTSDRVAAIETHLAASTSFKPAN